MKVALIVLSVGLLAEMVSALTCLSCVRHTHRNTNDNYLNNVIQGALNRSDGFSSACGDKDPKVDSVECDESQNKTCSTYQLEANFTLTMMGDMTEHNISSVIRGCSKQEAECTDEVNDAKQILQKMAEQLEDVNIPGDTEVSVKIDSVDGVACFCEENKCNKKKSSEIKAASSADIPQMSLASILLLVTIIFLQ